MRNTTNNVCHRTIMIDLSHNQKLFQKFVRNEIPNGAKNLVLAEQPIASMGCLQKHIHSL